MAEGAEPRSGSRAPLAELRFASGSYEETLRFAKKFAALLHKGDIVCLFGDLGAGKTAFVKGLASGLRINPVHVHSPTFTLMNLYDGKVPLYHFDLYRISENDLYNLGYEEFFYGKGITAVEWSERLGVLIPQTYWKVELRHAGEDYRTILVTAFGPGLRERLGKARGKTLAQLATVQGAK